MSRGSGKRRRGGRALSPEEAALWDSVAGSTTPLSPKPRVSVSLPGSDTNVRATKAIGFRSPSIAERPLSIGARWNAKAIQTQLLGPEVSRVGRPQAGLDRRTAERLRKGDRPPDARIDLHGMTAERAHSVCMRFLAQSLAQDHRVVLVITGKGRRDADGMPSDRGVLRQSLPGWLRATPLAHCIVGIYEAHQRHGGAGAFYVYLKKNR